MNDCPFVSKQIRKGKISFGLSSYGYDGAQIIKIFTNVNCVVDPKFLKRKFCYQSRKGVYNSPNSFALARTIEYFKIPEDVLVICLGKSLCKTE